MNLQTRLYIQSDTTATKGTTPSIVKDFTPFPITYAWESGTGANQANLVYRAANTIAASGSTTIDLTSGLFDVFGDAVNFARIKALVIYNTGTVEISPTGTFEGFGSGQFNVMPGGAYSLVAPGATGYVVTNGVSDTIQIDNLSVSVTAAYTIIIIGATA